VNGWDCWARATELLTQFIGLVETLFIWLIALALLAIGLFGGSINIEIRGLDRFFR
jgi:hypothetical protein